MKAMTEMNLMSAFGGESQARNRYDIYAEHAEREGFPNVARLFIAVAYAERIHAKSHFRVLKDSGDSLVVSGGGFGFKSTSENLQVAIDGEDFEIYRFDGAEVVQLTDNLHDDLNPVNHAGQVVWQGWDGDDFEIYLFENDQVTQLTADTEDDIDPRIHGGIVVWQRSRGQEGEILIYEQGLVTHLTQNSTEDRSPRIDQGRVVWEGSPAALGEDLVKRELAKVRRWAAGELTLTSAYLIPYPAR